MLRRDQIAFAVLLTIAGCCAYALATDADGKGPKDGRHSLGLILLRSKVIDVRETPHRCAHRSYDGLSLPKLH